MGGSHPGNDWTESGGSNEGNHWTESTGGGGRSKFLQFHFISYYNDKSNNIIETFNNS